MDAAVVNYQGFCNPCSIGFKRINGVLHHSVYCSRLSGGLWDVSMHVASPYTAMQTFTTQTNSISGGEHDIQNTSLVIVILFKGAQNNNVHDGVSM